MARLVSKLVTKTSPIARNANLPSVWSLNIRESPRGHHLMCVCVIILLFRVSYMWMVLLVKFIGGYSAVLVCFWPVVELCYVPMSTEFVLWLLLGWRLHEPMFYRLLWLLLPGLGKQCGAE